MTKKLQTIYNTVRKPLKVMVYIILILYFSLFANLHNIGWAPEVMKVQKVFATTTLRPAGSDGTYTAWTPLGGGSHYVEVDEAVADGDTSYVSSAAAGNRDSWNLADGQIPVGSNVVAIQICSTGKNSHPSKDSTFMNFYRLGGGDTDGASNNPPNGSYQEYCNTWSGLSWTPTDIDNLEIGVYMDTTAPGSNINVTQSYLVVSYYVIQNLQTDCAGQNCDQLGQTFNISGDFNNQTTANVVNSTIDYTVYIDDDPADSQPSANEGYADYTAADCDTWQPNGADANYSHQTTLFSVNAGASGNDSWQCENTVFPSVTTYSIYAKWYLGGVTYDTANVTFASVPTLNHWLLTLLILLIIFLAYRQGYLKLLPISFAKKGSKSLTLNKLKGRDFEVNKKYITDIRRVVRRVKRPKK